MVSRMACLNDQLDDATRDALKWPIFSLEVVRVPIDGSIGEPLSGDPVE